ncbi:hypothetical protein D8S78_11020 [Natrialba swarupiae]|nr:hypothetical protein [Natrialba swarupiae]
MGHSGPPAQRVGGSGRPDALWRVMAYPQVDRGQIGDGVDGPYQPPTVEFGAPTRLLSLLTSGRHEIEPVSIDSCYHGFEPHSDEPN